MFYSKAGFSPNGGLPNRWELDLDIDDLVDCVIDVKDYSFDFDDLTNL